MSESKFWKHIKDHVGHNGHWDRIESHSTSQGRPDVNICLEGVVVDIELKVFDPRKGGFVLRANQNAWIGNRIRANGRVFIFARYGDQASRQYFLIPGRCARNLIHDRSYEGWLNQAAYVWNKEVNWEQLLRVLKGTAS